MVRILLSPSHLSTVGSLTAPLLFRFIVYLTDAGIGGKSLGLSASRLNTGYGWILDSGTTFIIVDTEGSLCVPSLTALSFFLTARLAQ